MKTLKKKPFLRDLELIDDINELADAHIMKKGHGDEGLSLMKFH